MCGIAGVLEVGSGLTPQTLHRVVDAMTDRLQHRGPDARGTWFDDAVVVGLGHRRLAIVDLTEEGAQPMASASGRYQLTFNGEIYNFPELRTELESAGHHFRGRSDTEVLLAGIEQWGLEKTLEKVNGMFAIGLWDREDRVLTLARDRIGEKPLSYAQFGSSFMFASEVRAFHAHPSFDAAISNEGLGTYFKYLCVPAPFSIFQGVKKLMPGMLVKVRVADGRLQVTPPEAYWDAASHLRKVVLARKPLSDGEALEQLETTLTQAIKRRTLADVPLGTFLSGGTDSALVTALMQASGSGQVKTYSMGVEDARYDEAPRAKAIAQHLGTQHTEQYVTERDALNVVPELGALYDEPFADSSQIPVVLVSRLARKHVTVALAGDGGDELFGGYPKYTYVPELWNRLSKVPASFRALGATALGAIPRRIGDRVRTLEKARRVMSARSAHEFFHNIAAIWKRPSDIIRDGVDSADGWTGAPLGVGTPAEALMFQDLTGYLPDDLLVKVDRASMSTALEVRVPFLDPEVIDLAWGLPESMKLRGGMTKWILKQQLRKMLPTDLVDGPKKGFSVPLGRWLTGPLRSWAGDLLGSASGHALRSDAIQRAWKKQLKDGDASNHQVWGVLMFREWEKALQRDRAATR